MSEKQDDKNMLKPKRNELGLDIKYDSEILENDIWAQNMLREVGKTMRVPGHDYIGSAAIHFYTSSLAKTVASKHQFTLGDLNESLAAIGLQNFSIEMKKHYGRRHSTTNKKDKR